MQQVVPSVTPQNTLKDSRQTLHTPLHHIFDSICRLVNDDDRDSAECWVINTCTVKSPSQSAMDNLIVKGQTGGKALVVAGCVPQGDRRAKQLLGLSVIGAPQL